MRFFLITISISGLVLILLTAINSHVDDYTTIKSALYFFPEASNQVSRVRSIISEYKSHHFHSVETIHIDDIQVNPKNKYNKRIYIPFHKIPRKFIFAIISQDKTGVFRRKYGGDENKSQLMYITSIWRDYFSLNSSSITYDVVKYPKQCNSEALIHCFLAIKILEGSYSTNLDKLIEFYVNAKYFGLRSFGLAAASINYFAKMPKDLSIAEAAYLAGVLKNPRHYHPIKHKTRAIARRNRVIEQMLKHGHISREEADPAKQENLLIR